MDNNEAPSYETLVRFIEESATDTDRQSLLKTAEAVKDDPAGRKQLYDSLRRTKGSKGLQTK